MHACFRGNKSSLVELMEGTDTPGVQSCAGNTQAFPWGQDAALEGPQMNCSIPFER